MNFQGQISSNGNPPTGFSERIATSCRRLTSACILISMLAAAPLDAGTGWTLSDTGTGSTFNGVSIGEDGFAVLVGDGGTIVHRSADGTTTAVVSGTTEDLFDVFVVDETTAVATGLGVVLHWNGTSWSTLVDDPADPVFTSVWVPPEKDVAVFNVPGNPTFRRVLDLGTGDPTGFNSVSGFDIAYCGRSDDIKTVVQDGSILNFDNVQVPAPGTGDTFGVLFDNSASPLNLTAAWFPPGACPPGPLLPFAAFAIDSNSVFYRFDFRTGWSEMPVDGFAIPMDHTMTWLAGSDPSNIVAVGFRPAAGGGNEAVVWLWDGEIWAEDTTLPPGTPGLADVDFRFEYTSDGVFLNGFEAPILAQRAQFSGGTVDILAAAENGRRLFSTQLFPESVAELEVKKTLLTNGPFQEGDTVVYRVEVFNWGSFTANDVTLRDAFWQLDYFDDDCNTDEDHRGHRVLGVDQLPPGTRLSCQFTFTISESASNENEFANVALVWSSNGVSGSPGVVQDWVTTAFP